MGNACVSPASGTSTRLTSPTVKQKPLLLVTLGLDEGVTGWSRQLAVIRLVPGPWDPLPVLLSPHFKEGHDTPPPPAHRGCTTSYAHAFNFRSPQ